MIEFFRFAGLSVKTSRHCAKQCVAMDANTPRKLNKYLGMKQCVTLLNISYRIDHIPHVLLLPHYLIITSFHFHFLNVPPSTEEVNGFHLTDLGMDIVDSDMVLKTLRTEYGAVPGSKVRPIQFVCMLIFCIWQKYAAELFINLPPIS